MADQVMTGGTELDAIRPELWSAVWYSTLLASLPMNDSVARDYEGEVRQLGDIVNCTQWPEFDAAEEILEDQKVEADAVTATNIQLTINKQVVKDYIVTDRAKLQTLEHANALRDLVIHSIMKKMQSIIFGLVAPSTSAPDHAIGYDSGSTLALADVLEAKELLDAQNVPDDGSRCLVAGAAQFNDLFNVAQFSSRDYVDGAVPIPDAAFSSRLLGFIPKMTTEAAANTTYLFHPSFMQMAVQQNLNVKVFDQGVDGRRSSRVNTDVLFGVSQFSNLRVVTIS